MDCIFCKIIEKEIPANIRYEDDEILAFDDINPKSPTHILIIPKTHIPTLNDVDKAKLPILSKMVQAAQQLTQELGIADRGYRIVMNCNSEGGQEVYHIHLHVLGGKKLTWPNL